MRSEQVLPLRIRVDPGVMAMKGFSTIPRACNNTFWGGSYSSTRDTVSIF